MGVEIQWLGVAEASAYDGRGSLTLVAVNQNVVIAPELPVTRKRSVVALVSCPDNSGVEPGDSGTFEVSVKDPAGKDLVAAKQTMTLEESKWPGVVPIGFHFSGDLNLKLEKYGIYAIHISIEIPEGEVATADAPLYVVEPVD